jgi:hypothetical protein
MTVQEAPGVVTDAPIGTPLAEQPVGIAPATVPARSLTSPAADVRPIGGGQLVRRIVVLVFGLIQIVIGLRVILLLLDARAGNPLVSGILNVSQVFVAPFNGILNTNALSSGGSVLDVSAIVAFVGWSILELIILWAVGIFRREPA